MDKNKNRNDLLAAGRKKLQQFRQKKDGKGSKSSGKSGKPEQNVTAEAGHVAAKQAVSSVHVPEGEVSSVDDSYSGVNDASAPHAGENSMNTNTNAAAIDQSLMPILPKTGIVEVPLGELGAGEIVLNPSVGEEQLVDSSNINEGQSTCTVDIEDSRTISLGTSETVLSEVKSVHAGLPGPVDLSTPLDLVDAINPVTVAVDFPHGEDQEADNLGSKQVDRSSGIELGLDERLSFSELGDNAETHTVKNSGETTMQEASREAEHTEKLDVSASSGATNQLEGLEMDGHSVLSHHFPKLDGPSTVNPGVTDQKIDDAMATSFNVEKLEIACKFGDYGSNDKEVVQVDMQDKTFDPERVSITKVHGQELPLGCKVVNLSFGANISSITLSQLAEVLRGLDENDFKLMLTSRESSSNAELMDSGGSIVSEYDLSDVLERLKEQLYLTSFAKDVFHLQLNEQSKLKMELDHQNHQLVDEMSIASVSLNEVQGRNTTLTEELAQCRSELQALACVREQLQKQCHTAKVEVEELSARAEELNIKLEKSHGDLSSLSAELTNCRSSLAASQVDIDNLRGSLTVLNEEKRKLEDEKVYFDLENKKLSTELADCRHSLTSLQAQNASLNENLALMTDERRKLEEEKEYVIRDNQKLLTDLADCKTWMEALQVENANLNATLSEERKDLVEEKESFTHETKKLSTELMDCRGLLEAQQVEITNLNGSLALVMEERSKLGEEKQNFLGENEKLLTELADCKCSVADLHVKHSKAVDDLKDATLHLEQLTKENTSLKSNLDMHKAKLVEFDYSSSKMSSQSEYNGDQVGSSEFTSRSQESAADNNAFHQIPGKWDGETSSSVFKEQLPDGIVDSSDLKNLKLDAYDDSFGFVVLKGHMKEMEKILQKFENAIEGLHSHSISLSRSSDEVAVPVVSKLIQAFESKAHSDDQEAEGVEEVPLPENQSFADQFLLTKKEIQNLKVVLKELVFDADKASELFKSERDARTLVNVAFKELSVANEALKEHSNILEAANIELVVLDEIMKQYVFNNEAKSGEFLILFDALRHQEIILEAHNKKLAKLNDYQSRIGDLQSQLNEIHLSSDEMASSICTQVENLYRDMDERGAILEQEWNSTVSEIIQTIGKLDASVGRLFLSTVSTNTYDGLDISSNVSASVDAATKVIEDLHEKLQAATTDYEAMRDSYETVTVKFNDLHGKHELAISLLDKIYGNLRKLLNDSCGYVEQSEELLDLLCPAHYDTQIEKLGMFLYERLQLESENRKVNLKLMDRAKDIEELTKRCFDLDAILKLVEDVEGVPELVDTEIVPDKCTSRLVSVISFLVRKHKEADDQLSLSREMFSLKEMELGDLKGQADQLSFLIVQYENEMLILKESLSQAVVDRANLCSELQEKVVELEQSEQRVSSLREKLGIAVSKGKGLVVQRDSLKQSLAETSGELEKCLQELQLKDARLREIETKLKTYSEAGERVEALESELSYIRNSATALRESFLLKDSVLQRIEEILEDLELPEHFHSRDIIEKVDWLARSVTGNSLPLTDWDQKSSVGGGSYSDAGFVVMDAWKEDIQPNSSSGDDLRKKYDELQSKFYGLAEQNEMLEQSLVERNNVVQRWEEILDRINMPSHLRSVEPEDRIELLVRALSEADQHCNSLQQKIDNFETMCGSLTADLEESQRKSSSLEAALQAVTYEKEHLSESLERLIHDYGEVSEKSTQFELDIVKLQDEVNALQERLVEKVGTEEHIQHIEGEMRRLRNLINDVLQDAGVEDDVSDDSNMEELEQLLRKFMEKCKTFSLGNRVLEDAVDEHITDKADATHDEKRKVDSGHAMEHDMTVLKKELENVLGDLMLVKEERDRYTEKSQSLIHEVEALDIKKQELQELLNLEEQKSASVREKLNVAVRKGKSLVQQRDSLKQTVEKTNTELERLKSDISSQENTLSQYKQKIRDLSTYQERVEALASESLFLRDCLAETEFSLQEKGHAMSMILNTLSSIDVGFEFDISDPVEKLKQIGRRCRDLHAAVASSEHDSSKSKRAAELLLGELNEVQERNDGLQEDLEKAMSELSEAFRKRDSAEAAKYEAVSRLQKLSSELVALKSNLDQLRKDFYDVNNLLGDHLSKDLEYLHNLESSVNSCMKPNDVLNVVGIPFSGAHGNIMSSNSEMKDNFLTTADSLSDSKMQPHFDDNILVETCSVVGHQLQDFVIEMGALKEKLYKHSILLQEEAKRLCEVVGIVHGEMKSQRQSFESMKEKVIWLEHIEEEKNTESDILRRNISLLYEACNSSIMEIKNWKVQMVGNGLDAADQGVILELPAFFDGDDLFSGQALLSSEEYIRTMANRLLSVVKESVRIQTEIVEGGEKEMKTTISNLQKDLQEKDIQKERICVELVGQIKEAEAAAKGYLLDLQSTKVQVYDLERKIEVMEEEHSMLQHRVKELQDGEVTSKDLQERVRSLTDVLTSKEQEIEALMQALDEEETQMEELTNKIAELEQIVQQKNLDLENLEASRGKAIKKLSITVSKFDELHGLSASLLSEVEKLQSQLHERDTEVSFLRQEVTRCTNDALIASQQGNKRKSDEIHDLLSWLNSMISRVHNVQFDDKESSQVDEFKVTLQKQILSIISELEDLRVVAQNRDTLLQVERSRVEELVRKEEFLENSLREKDSQLSMLQGAGDSGQATNTTSEIVEVEAINKWAVPGTSIAPQVRSLRKVNNDQVAIAIDMDQGSSSRLEDEDDDKAHGFKSLTTSRVIPRFTRPVTDMIDGLWVSCDRALMRQPALRLGVIIYWAVLHALLAIFVV